MNKNHSVHIKINEEQFEYLSEKGNKSEYVRELIKKDIQGGNDNAVLLETVRLMLLKQPDVLPAVVKPVRVVESVKEDKPTEQVQGDGSLLDQFGWDN